MDAKLPSNQRHVLKLLREHGTWQVGAPWVVVSSTKTRIALRGLVQRGLAVVDHIDGVLIYRPATVAEHVARRRRGVR